MAYDAQPLDTTSEDYRERIKGEPGLGAAGFFRFLAALNVLGTALLVLQLFPDSLALAAGAGLAGTTSAALCYSLAIIVENVIAIRRDLEFQSEVIEERESTATPSA